MTAIVGVLLIAAAQARQQSVSPMLSGEQLVQALRRGGYVLLMRHASAPQEAPDKASADPGNVTRERQLDDTGRRTAAAMGAALRDLGIPIGAVFTSPTYRAVETARLAQLPRPRTQEELGDGGHSMQGVSDAQADWLKRKVRERPNHGNTVMVTHLPNISRAFPEWAAGLSNGGVLVLRPDGKGGVTLVARIAIEQWPQMALNTPHRQ